MNKNGFIDALKTAVLTMSDEEVMACFGIVGGEHQSRKARRQSSVKDSLSEGDHVYFMSAKHGRIDGYVKKVKYKKAIVETKSGNWDVPFHMLKHC